MGIVKIVGRLLKTYFLKTFFILGVKEGEKQKLCVPKCGFSLKQKLNERTYSVR